MKKNKQNAFILSIFALFGCMPTSAAPCFSTGVAGDSCITDERPECLKSSIDVPCAGMYQEFCDADSFQQKTALHANDHCEFSFDLYSCCEIETLNGCYTLQNWECYEVTIHECQYTTNVPVVNTAVTAFDTRCRERLQGTPTQAGTYNASVAC